MKSILRLAALALALGCSTAHASLIGDTITVQHFFPDLGSVYTNHVVVVQAGVGDVTIGADSAYSVNPEANSVLVDFLSTTSWVPSAFNGLVVSNIDDTITGVTISTNMAGWADSRFSFTAHSFSANWQSLSFTADTFFNVTLNTGAGSVPDGGTSIVLLGLAMAGIVALRRK